MTGFLNRLAGFATGSPAPGAACIVLPPRFAPVPAAPLQHQDWVQADSFADAQEASEPRTASGVEHDTRQEPVSSFSSRTSHPVAVEIAKASEAPLLRQTRKLPDEQSPAPVPPNVKSSLADPPAIAELRFDRASPLNASAARFAPMLNLASRPQGPAPVTLTASPAQPQNNHAPLSADVLASRPQLPRSEPLVYVTIDRIDVRVAPAAKSAPAPSRTRRAASLSLSDYLRGSERGGRT